MNVRSLISTATIVCLIFALGACGSGDDGASDPSSDPADLPVNSHPETAEWSPLFAEDLSNAVLDSADSWSVNDGVLLANDRSTIWTQEEYGNFVLDFEAKAPDGTNSGVFFRTADTDDILSALELQIFNAPGPDAEADSLHAYGGRNGMGALYDLKGPSDGSPNPAGEWNRFTVTAQDSMIYVVMNGDQIHEMNLNDWTEPGQTPDGREHKFDRALKDQARSGPIGLQGIHSENGLSAEYRNLRIRRLGD